MPNTTLTHIDSIIEIIYQARLAEATLTTLRNTDPNFYSLNNINEAEAFLALKNSIEISIPIEIYQDGIDIIKKFQDSDQYFEQNIKIKKNGNKIVKISMGIREAEIFATEYNQLIFTKHVSQMPELCEKLVKFKNQITSKHLNNKERIISDICEQINNYSIQHKTPFDQIPDPYKRASHAHLKNQLSTSHIDLQFKKLCSDGDTLFENIISKPTKRNSLTQRLAINSDLQNYIESLWKENKYSLKQLSQLSIVAQQRKVINEIYDQKLLHQFTDHYPALAKFAGNDRINILQFFDIEDGIPNSLLGKTKNSLIHYQTAINYFYAYCEKVCELIYQEYNDTLFIDNPQAAIKKPYTLNQIKIALADSILEKTAPLEAKEKLKTIKAITDIKNIFEKAFEKNRNTRVIFYKNPLFFEKVVRLNQVIEVIPKLKKLAAKRPNAASPYEKKYSNKKVLKITQNELSELIQDMNNCDKTSPVLQGGLLTKKMTGVVEYIHYYNKGVKIGKQQHSFLKQLSYDTLIPRSDLIKNLSSKKFQEKILKKYPHITKKRLDKYLKAIDTLLVINERLQDLTRVLNEVKLNVVDIQNELKTYNQEKTLQKASPAKVKSLKNSSHMKFIHFLSYERGMMALRLEEASKQNKKLSSALVKRYANQKIDPQKLKHYANIGIDLIDIYGDISKVPDKLLSVACAKTNPFTGQFELLITPTQAEVYSSHIINDFQNRIIPDQYDPAIKAEIIDSLEYKKEKVIQNFSKNYSYKVMEKNMLIEEKMKSDGIFVPQNNKTKLLNEFQLVIEEITKIDHCLYSKENITRIDFIRNEEKYTKLLLEKRAKLIKKANNTLTKIQPHTKTKAILNIKAIEEFKTLHLQNRNWKENRRYSKLKKLLDTYSININNMMNSHGHTIDIKKPTKNKYSFSEVSFRSVGAFFTVTDIARGVNYFYDKKFGQGVVYMSFGVASYYVFRPETFIKYAKNGKSVFGKKAANYIVKTVFKSKGASITVVFTVGRDAIINAEELYKEISKFSAHIERDVFSKLPLYKVTKNSYIGQGVYLIKRGAIETGSAINRHGLRPVINSIDNSLVYIGIFSPEDEVISTEWKKRIEYKQNFILECQHIWKQKEEWWQKQENKLTTHVANIKNTSTIDPQRLSGIYRWARYQQYRILNPQLSADLNTPMTILSINDKGKIIEKKVTLLNLLDTVPAHTILYYDEEKRIKETMMPLKYNKKGQAVTPSIPVSNDDLKLFIEGGRTVIVTKKAVSKNTNATSWGKLLGGHYSLKEYFNSFNTDKQTDLQIYTFNAGLYKNKIIENLSKIKDYSGKTRKKIKHFMHNVPKTLFAQELTEVLLSSNLGSTPKRIWRTDTLLERDTSHMYFMHSTSVEIIKNQPSILYNVYDFDGNIILKNSSIAQIKACKKTLIPNARFFETTKKLDRSYLNQLIQEFLIAPGVGIIARTKENLKNVTRYVNDASDILTFHIKKDPQNDQKTLYILQTFDGTELEKETSLKKLSYIVGKKPQYIGKTIISSSLNNFKEGKIETMHGFTTLPNDGLHRVFSQNTCQFFHDLKNVYYLTAKSDGSYQLSNKAYKEILNFNSISEISDYLKLKLDRKTVFFKPSIHLNRTSLIKQFITRKNSRIPLESIQISKHKKMFLFNGGQEVYLFDQKNNQVTREINPEYILQWTKKYHINPERLTYWKINRWNKQFGQRLAAFPKNSIQAQQENFLKVLRLNNNPLFHNGQNIYQKNTLNFLKQKQDHKHVYTIIK